MTVIQRLIFRYITQLIVVLTIITTSLIIGMVILAFSIFAQDAEKDVANVTKEVLEQSITIENGKFNLHDNLRQSILNQEAWFQLIDEDGKVKFSLNAPTSAKKRYNKSEMITLIEESNHSFTLWALELDSKPYIALFQGNRPLYEVTESLKSLETTLTKPQIDNEIISKLAALKANLYIYNSNNVIIQDYIYNENLEPPSLNEIVDYQLNYWDLPESVSSYTSEKFNLSYVAISKNPSYTEGKDQSTNKSVLFSIFFTFLILFFILFLLACWYAFKLGNPLIHIIDWIQALAKDIYKEPVNKKGCRKSIKSNGNFKSSYKPFKEVIISLNKLAKKLEENEIQQRKIQETREEWITGLSHDLKTPLSAIYGYAVMINNPDYCWNEAELKEFTSIIERNAIYMSDLIEDINLTYRIKNDALPLIKESIEMNQFIHKVSTDFKTNQLKQGHIYKILTDSEMIFHAIDSKYFKRIVNNLLGNAAKFNPTGTIIKIETKKTRNGFSLYIKDNGRGMDQHTIDNLFNRYYRGTTTDTNTDGTGLGLAITKQLVELHGGEIKVDTKLGIGTNISLVFKSESE